MNKTSHHRSLHAARASKKDEFYTQLSDIEKELKNYKDHFKGKVVLCNCDDPWVSNFFHYFAHNFENLGLKKLITTCYKNSQPHMFSKHESDKAVWLEYTGDKDGDRVPSPAEIGVKRLNGDGDFRSGECIELLKQADIVVTNPPFSLFREYLTQLMTFGKKFLIVSNKNAITYKEVFKLVQENRMWLGYRNVNSDIWFQLPDDAEKWERIENGKKLQHISACWFTNLDTTKRHENLILYKSYSPESYPKYDNYDAIEVSKVADMPEDYDGAMGVPITFLDKYNPDQFELLGLTDRENSSGLRTKKYSLDEVPNPNDLDRGAVIKNGKTYRAVYMRIVIRRKKGK